MPAETEDAANLERSETRAEEELPTVEEELPAPDEVLAWLARIRPAAVPALLKDPDYRAAVTPAFSGFRPDAKGFSVPLVRSRLAQAAAKDAKLARKLRELSETDVKPAPSAPISEKPVLAAPPPPGPDPLPALRAERDARRRERDTARQELAAAQSERDAAGKARLQAEAERDEAQKLAKKQAERIARLERQAAQARQTESRLVKALNEDKVSPPPVPRPHRAGSETPRVMPSGSPWLAAVKHLLDKGKFETSLGLAEDVLKIEPDNLDALEMTVRGWEGRQEPRSALIPARRLLARQVQLSDFAAAAETLLTLFRLVPAPEQAEPDARLLLTALPPDDGAAVASMRLMLSRLRGSDPGAHDWLSAYVTGRTSLEPVLMPPPGALGPDDPLPLPFQLGREVTARHLTDAVDRAQTTLVEAARIVLNAADPETSARVWAALTAAASDDPARLLALRRAPRGAAVVDGSNVAWFDQESLVQGKPRLRHLLAMRRALWTRGFFPVILYADANLPYFIDDKPALLSMRDHHALTLVDAGTVADEVLLRIAKQMGAPLITNDKMEDWDPEGEVRKVRYAISISGEAHLLSEI